jgi:DMSO/TMAO reductase YedYZ molybdopterin-dependent catalytic subunit
MKTKSMVFTVSVTILLTQLFLFGQEPPTTISVRGDIQSPLQFSVQELKAKFGGQMQDIQFTAGMDKSVKVGTGIPLLSVVQAAVLSTDKEIKHHNLKFVVVAEAYDGYRVVFSLAELLPQGGNTQAWLIWNVDGKPLAGKEAPFRLVVPTDKDADRYIFGVTKVILVDEIKVVNQMSKT